MITPKIINKINMITPKIINKINMITLYIYHGKNH